MGIKLGNKTCVTYSYVLIGFLEHFTGTASSTDLETRRPFSSGAVLMHEAQGGTQLEGHQAPWIQP